MAQQARVHFVPVVPAVVLVILLKIPLIIIVVLIIIIIIILILLVVILVRVTWSTGFKAFICTGHPRTRVCACVALGSKAIRH